MDVSDILDGLNDAQRQAVGSDQSYIRVIAGAGSGKTKVLVQRLQWLMMVENISPHGILALTFTNKAAREMRDRLEMALKRPMSQIWMGTFHGICYRILRRYADKKGWSKEFSVMDHDDQLRMIKRLMRVNHLSQDDIKAKDLQSFINNCKEEGKRAADLGVSSHPLDAVIRQFYGAYEIACQRQASMDFSELLLLTMEILRDCPEVREQYQQRFQAILVDEFQDTNQLQFQIVNYILTDHCKLFVVGDDDQSIYSWRGARVENFLDLETYYPSLQTFRLEQNYRSTQNILDAANALIKVNEKRLGKTLWSEQGEGVPIDIYPAINEYDEGRYVIDEILNWVNQGGTYNECAILYRSNAQSRIFEELIVQHNLPYRVYGGLRFFERAEVKDALAYLRLTQQPNDDGALERILNHPPRGIGAKTLAQLREFSRIRNISLWEVLCQIDEDKAAFTARAYNAIKQFCTLIMTMTEEIQGKSSLKRALEISIHESGLLKFFEEKNNEDSINRIDNLNELINAGMHIDATKNEGESNITDFLADAALDAGEAQSAEGQDCIQLMTLHSAKGLEFPCVFIVGMEEEIFPSRLSIREANRLEEERRLAYVGVTRAMQKLCLSFAERRRFQGQDTYPEPSRFIYEIPETLTRAIRPMVYTQISQMTQNHHNHQTEDKAAYQAGDMVIHQRFGEGCILTLEGSGEHQRALVNFNDVGEKWLVLSFAKLQKI